MENSTSKSNMGSAISWKEQNKINREGMLNANEVYPLIINRVEGRTHTLNIHEKKILSIVLSNLQFRIANIKTKRRKHEETNGMIKLVELLPSGADKDNAKELLIIKGLLVDSNLVDIVLVNGDGNKKINVVFPSDELVTMLLEGAPSCLNGFSIDAPEDFKVYGRAKKQNAFVNGMLAKMASMAFIIDEVQLAVVETAFNNDTAIERKLTDTDIVYEAKMRILSVAIHNAKKVVGEDIFFPVSVDTRGRQYPVAGASGLNPQGSKVVRSFLTPKNVTKITTRNIRQIETDIIGAFNSDEKTNYISLLEVANHDHGTNVANMMFVLSREAKSILNGAKTTTAHIELDYVSNAFQHQAIAVGDNSLASQLGFVKKGRSAKAQRDVYETIMYMVTKNGSKLPKRLHEYISRDIVKKVAMPYTYGAGLRTSIFTVNRILRSTELSSDDMKSLATHIYNAVGIVAPASDNHRKVMKKVANKVAKALKAGETEVKWHVDGFIAYQESSKKESVKVTLSETNPTTGVRVRSSISLQAHVLDENGNIIIDSNGHAKAFAPNYTHSFDGAVERRNVSNIVDLGMNCNYIHDAVIVPAGSGKIVSNTMTKNMKIVHSNSTYRSLFDDLDSQVDLGFSKERKLMKNKGNVDMDNLYQLAGY